MNNLIKRTITGTIFVAAVVTSILFQTEYYTFTALFAIVNILAMKEFYGIVNAKKNVSVPTVYMLFCGIFLYLGCFWCALIDKPDEITGFIFLIIYMLSIAALIIMEIYRKKEHPTYDLAFSIYGQVVVALPFGLMNFIAREPEYLLTLFLLIWTFDTGAYLVGSTCGKHKMIERISPKKSWEGEIGGICLTVLISSLLGIYFFNEPVWRWIVFGLLVSVFGTYGDLSESMLKRASGLKDSGNILPGHGGMLDRFDSMLLAAPIIYVYIEILKAI